MRKQQGSKTFSHPYRGNIYHALEKEEEVEICIMYNGKPDIIYSQQLSPEDRPLE